MSDQPLLSYDYAKKANREAVLLLHGFMGGKEDWSGPAALLGEGWSHLTVDLPGHGETAARSLEDHDFTMPGCAARIIELLDFLKIEKCHLIAYSMGGRQGLYLLCHHPARFMSAVIESASPGLVSEAERAARKEHDSQLIDDLISDGMDKFLERWYAQPLFASLDQTDARFYEMKKRRLKNDPGQLARSLRHMGTGVQPSLWDQMSDIACPVLFVAGDKDEKYCRLAARMLPLCRRGEAAIIPGAGHNAHFERPAEFALTVHRFLQEHK